MNNPRRLTQREYNLIEFYSSCTLSMSPQEFYSKWGINQEMMAVICSRSLSTVRGWFASGQLRRYPSQSDLRHLALMNFILEHFEQIPPELWNLLCPANLIE